MFSNYTVLVGFVEDLPHIEKDSRTNENVVIFNIVTKNNKSVRSVRCIARGTTGDKVLGYARKGSFWTIGGVLYNLKSENMSKQVLTLKCLEIELHYTPEIPGDDLEAFVGKYDPEQMIKRATERRKKNDHRNDSN